MEEKIVLHGIETLMENIGTILIFVLIGMFMDKTLEMLLCLISFGILRTQAGGIHCSTKLKCRFCMALILILSVIMSEVIIISIYCQLVSYLLMIVIIIILAPAKGKKSEVINEQKRLKKKKYSVLIVIIACLSSLILEQKYSMAIMVALFFEIITLLPYEEARKICIKNLK